MALPNKLSAPAVATLLVVLAGCSGGGAPWSSPYSVDCRVKYGQGLDVTVKGPAAELGVILTDSSGATSSHVFSAQEMISNSATTYMRTDDPKPGTWVVTVKTVKPESVVAQKKIEVTPGELTDVKVVSYRCERENNLIPSRAEENNWNITAQLSIEKSGDLRCMIEDYNFRLNGHILDGADTYTTNFNRDGFYGHVFISRCAELHEPQSSLPIQVQLSAEQKRSRFSKGSVVLEGDITYDGGKKVTFKKILSQ